MSPLSQNPPSETPEVVPAEVSDLVEAIDQLPAELRSLVRPSLSRVLEGAKRRRQILVLVQEALSQLRLDMKYLVFDLEATRRERDEYRRQTGQP
ncbi:MAG: transcriptional regulator [Thermoguttaceae bacterium]